MTRQFLHSGWQVMPVSGDLGSIPGHIKNKTIQATIPGCIHTDLMDKNLIPDPYLNQNELDVRWIANIDWQYSTTFTCTTEMLEQEYIDLVCEGLDTVARIDLNGRLIGNAENMHLGYRFDVKEYLREGKNELKITFTSPNNHALLMEAQLGARPFATTNSPIPFNFIRKMACNFGWDWGPQLTTVGIWQPIYLEGWVTGRINSIRPLVEEATSEAAIVDVIVDVEREDNAVLSVTARLTAPDGSSVEQQEYTSRSYDDTVVTLTVQNPQLWWPVGHGAQPLYHLHIELRDENGNLIDTREHKIGLRTTRLNTQADDTGSQFTLEINGKSIFCKGANWIPDDCFVTRVDEARYRQRLTQAINANMNILRIWGGGIYETDTFYSLCDEMGILVWQDFLFACAAYPEEEPYNELVKAEAEYQVKRLSKFASLVIWNGNNENIWGYFDWGWQQHLKPEGSAEELTWGLGFYLTDLPAIVSELDPSRPYWPGSPYSGSLDIHPLNDNHGCKHVWDVWNAVDYTVHRNYTPRFVSEFGHQAPPTYATLKQSIPENQLTPDSPAMLHHQKAINGNDKLNNRLLEHFDMPASFDDWHYLTQLNQVRSVQTGVEWYRSRQPVCMGTIYWQINDCWPVTSWACVDGYGRLKPLWYATRHFYADHLLTIQPEGDDSLAVFVNNDSDTTWQGEVILSRMTLGGETMVSDRVTVEVAPRTNKKLLISEEIAMPDNPQGEMVVAQLGNQSAFWFFDIDKNLEYPTPKFDAELTGDGINYHLKITARTLLRDLTVFPDRIDPEATIDDQVVTLLPGQSVTFTIKSQWPLNKEALTQTPVLQCANRFGKQA